MGIPMKNMFSRQIFLSNCRVHVFLLKYLTNSVPLSQWCNRDTQDTLEFGIAGVFFLTFPPNSTKDLSLENLLGTPHLGAQMLGTPRGVFLTPTNIGYATALLPYFS